MLLLYTEYDPTFIMDPFRTNWPCKVFHEYVYVYRYNMTIFISFAQLYQRDQYLAYIVTDTYIYGIDFMFVENIGWY